MEETAFNMLLAMDSEALSKYADLLREAAAKYRKREKEIDAAIDTLAAQMRWHRERADHLEEIARRCKLL